MTVSPQVEVVPIDSVRPHPKNTRRHPQEQIELIKNSLREFGQYRPIVVHAGTDYILAGNGVYEAARQLGWETIRIVRVECDETHALAILMADNRLAELSWWDYESMAAIPELQPVLEMPVFDESFVRMIEIEVDAILEAQANALMQDEFLPVDRAERGVPAVRNPAAAAIIRTVMVAVTRDDDMLARQLHAHLREVDSEYAENTEPEEYDGRLFLALLRRTEPPTGAD
jgi:hypothetical protein